MLGEREDVGVPSAEVAEVEVEGRGLRGRADDGERGRVCSLRGLGSDGEGPEEDGL